MSMDWSDFPELRDHEAMAEEAPDDAVQSLVTMRVLNAGHPKA